MIGEKILRLGASSLLMLLVSGCVTTGGVPQGNVAMVDTSERAHLDNRLNMTDLMSAAEKLTTEMMLSPQIEEWGNSRPKLIVGRIHNRSEDDLIPEEELYHSVKSIIVNSGVARIVSEDATDFDYIMKGTLNDTVETNLKGAELKLYRITLELYSIDGEMIGSWHDTTKGFLKAGKPVF